MKGQWVPLVAGLVLCAGHLASATRVGIASDVRAERRLLKEEEGAVADSDFGSGLAMLSPGSAVLLFASVLSNALESAPLRSLVNRQSAPAYGGAIIGSFQLPIPETLATITSQFASLTDAIGTGNVSARGTFCSLWGASRLAQDMLSSFQRSNPIATNLLASPVAQFLDNTVGSLPTPATDYLDSTCAPFAPGPDTTLEEYIVKAIGRNSISETLAGAVKPLDTLYQQQIKVKASGEEVTPRPIVSFIDRLTAPIATAQDSGAGGGAGGGLGGIGGGLGDVTSWLQQWTGGGAMPGADLINQWSDLANGFLGNLGFASRQSVSSPPPPPPSPPSPPSGGFLKELYDTIRGNVTAFSLPTFPLPGRKKK